MTAQLWAITARSGEVRLVWTASADDHPSDSGHRSECRNRNVWPLDREPLAYLGETVDHATGALVFDPELVRDRVLAEIRAEASSRIVAIAPLWRQLNDLHEPDQPGAIARRAHVSAVRDWSNRLEQSVMAAASIDDIAAILTEL